MREIRTYGSEGGGAVSSPYPYRISFMRQGVVLKNGKAENQ